MFDIADPQGSLTALAPPRRNRFYVGKLLSASDFEKEQEYGQSKRRLSNRLQLGAGVVCGLDVVATDDGRGIRVTAGMALDGWGREIVVPGEVVMSPLCLTDGDEESGITADPLPSSLRLTLGYQELLADETPAAGGALPPGAGGLQAGTVVESYRLRVLEGAAPDLVDEGESEILDLVRAGRIHAALCRLSAGGCADVPDDPSIALANIAVAADGSFTVDGCGPRAIVPTNLALARLLRCLATGGAAPTTGATGMAP